MTLCSIIQHQFIDVNSWCFSVRAKCLKQHSLSGRYLKNPVISDSFKRDLNTYLLV